MGTSLYYFLAKKKNFPRLACRCVLSTTSFIIFFGSIVAQANDKISVGQVDGKDIWLSHVLRAAELLPEEYRQAPMENYFSQLVSDIIDSQLAAAAAREDSFDQNPEVVEAMTIAANRILAESWISEKVRKEVTEKAIQNAYDIFVSDTASREQITASHILVKTEAAAKSIIDDLEKGKDFAELAKEKSTGPSGPNGGELGTFGRGKMVPAFETAAFGLAAGSFSKSPIQTQFGWHIIKVDKKEIVPAPDIETMRGQLANNLSVQAYGRILEELRAKHDIQVRSFEEIRAEAIKEKD